MSALIVLLVIIMNFILQSTIIHHFSIFGIVPNTALIIIIIIGLLRGGKTASIMGLIAGLLQDIVFSPIVGINGFIFFFIGYSVGLMENKLSKDNIAVPFILVILYTIFYHFLYYIFMFFLSYNISLFGLFKNTVIIEAIYNSLISILIYKGFTKIFVIPSIRFGKR